MQSNIEKDLEVICNFINRHNNGTADYRDFINKTFQRIGDYCSSPENVKKDNHYHYFVSYALSGNAESFGLGEMVITTQIKIRHKEIKFLRKIVLETAKENDEKVENTVILSFFTLECACDE